MCCAGHPTERVEVTVVQITAELDETQGNTQLDVAGETKLYEQLRNFWHPVAFSEDL